MGLFNRKNKTDVRPMVRAEKPAARPRIEVAQEEERIVPLPPVYCLTEQDVSRGFDELGAIQRAQDERLVDPAGAARRMVALADGVAGYYLRRGGNRNLYSILVEGLMGWSNVTYGAKWLGAMGTSEGDAAGVAFKIIGEFTERYAFLEETEGRAVPGDELSPMPARIETGLQADGWRRDKNLLIRMFDAPDHYVQEVLLYPEEGGFELVVGLMELPDEVAPAWVAAEDGTPYSCALSGGRVMLKDRILDQRTPVAEISARAAALAQRATDLEALHADIGERQVRVTDPGSDDSLDSLAYELLRTCPFGMGLYGPGTLDELMAEFARLNPKILDSTVGGSGVGYAAGDGELAMLAMTGPGGSLVAVCQIGESSVIDVAMPFGGRDVANGWSIMIVSRDGVTLGTVGRLLEGAHAIPLWELDAFAHQRP